MTTQPPTAYRRTMAKEKPICGTCMGAGGEWVDQNGSSKKQTVWVPCKSCKGEGRR